MSCNCSNEILIRGGDGIAVTGSGSGANPFVVTADLPDFTKLLSVRDSSTVNLTLTGSGTPGDAFVVQAAVALRVEQLADFEDSQGPVAGETLVYVGSGDTGHWEARPVPAAPPGAVNVNLGLTGTGEAGTPLSVRVSNTGPNAGLSGLGTYIDVEGNLRADQPTTTTVAWGSDGISGLPAEFTPAKHRHDASDIDNQSKLNVGMIDGHRIVISQSTPTGTFKAGDAWLSW